MLTIMQSRWSQLRSVYRPFTFLEMKSYEIILKNREPFQMVFSHVIVFSRMRSKGYRFTLGVWVRVCSLDAAFTTATVRNRLQPSATVRNRSQPLRAVWPCHAMPMVSSAKGVIFGSFNCRVAAFRVRGRRGTSWHSDVFRDLWKVVLCGSHSTFATFSEDALHFSRQAQHFGDHHRDFAWQVQHFRRVLWLVLCESQCQGCVKW